MTAKVRPIFGDTQPLQRRPWPVDTRPSDTALRAATQAGWEDGERAGYVQGWRYGLICGLLAGLLLGAGGIVAAIHIGMLFGTAIGPGA